MQGRQKLGYEHLEDVVPDAVEPWAGRTACALYLALDLLGAGGVLQQTHVESSSREESERRAERGTDHRHGVERSGRGVDLREEVVKLLARYGA
ncbi:hypothetical protein ABG067_008597, partial [Albugo candida]